MLQGEEKNTSIDLIKEKMKKKRRKKALNDSNTSWSRSRSNKKGPNASFLLKTSLHANNKALAKALALAKHDTQQAHTSILEYQTRHHYMVQENNMRRQAEKDCSQRFDNIKQVLMKVTTNLLDAAGSLGQVLDLCTMPPLQDTSVQSAPRTSTSDDDSFANTEKTPTWVPCAGAEVVSKVIESAAHGMGQALVAMPKLIPQQPTERTPKAAKACQLPRRINRAGREREDRKVERPAPGEPEEPDAPPMFADQSPGECTMVGTKDVQDVTLPWPSAQRPSRRSNISGRLDIALANSSIDSLNEFSLPSKGSWQLYRTPPSRNLSTTPVQMANYDDLAPTPAVAKPPDPRRVTFNIKSASPELPAKTAALDSTFCVGENIRVRSPPRDDDASTGEVAGVELLTRTAATTSPIDDQDDLSKSRINYDDKIIRPWGNVQSDVPSKGPPDKDKAKKTKGSPQKLEKISKRHSKNGKQAMRKKAKSGIAPESFRRDMGVFDLSGGDSFSFPLKKLKPNGLDAAQTVICTHPEREKDSRRETVDSAAAAGENALLNRGLITKRSKIKVKELRAKVKESHPESLVNNVVVVTDERVSPKTTSGGDQLGSANESKWKTSTVPFEDTSFEEKLKSGDEQSGALNVVVPIAKKPKIPTKSKRSLLKPQKISKKRSKDDNKTAGKRFKSGVSSESFRRDMSVFDLSAGDSFSFPQQLKKLKSNMDKGVRRKNKDFPRSKKKGDGSCIESSTIGSLPPITHQETSRGHVESQMPGKAAGMETERPPVQPPGNREHPNPTSNPRKQKINSRKEKFPRGDPNKEEPHRVVELHAEAVRHTMHVSFDTDERLGPTDPVAVEQTKLSRKCLAGELTTPVKKRRLSVGKSRAEGDPMDVGREEEDMDWKVQEDSVRRSNRSRGSQVNYKEMSINCKMRRSPTQKKTYRKKKVVTNSIALDTITNIVT